MRILITFETNVSQISHHKHRISISAPDFFTDFLRGTLARRSHGIHNPKVIYLVSSITQKRNSVNPHIKFPPDFQIRRSGMCAARNICFCPRISMTCSKDILNRSAIATGSRTPCKALTTFFKAFLHTFFHAFFKTFLTAIQMTALPI